MAFVTATPTINNGALSNEVDMGSDNNASTVRATVVQASTVFYDTPATLDKAERLLAEAAGNGSQIVVFPEAFVGGYPHGSSFDSIIGIPKDKGREEFRKYHAAAINVPGNKKLNSKYRTFFLSSKYRSCLCLEQNLFFGTSLTKPLTLCIIFITFNFNLALRNLIF